MRVAFIQPSMTGLCSTDSMQPLVFSVLAGLTPPGIETVFFDERLEPVNMNVDVDLAAITVETYTAARAYYIADIFRSRNIPVVIGGYHPTFMADEAAEHADSVVIGEAEQLWQTVIADAQSGNLKQFYRQEKISDLNSIPFDRSIFTGKKYAPIIPVQFGRGCKFQCDFCSINVFYGNNIRHRPIGDIINEIKEIGQKYILFIDDNIFANVEQTEELFHALIPLKIRWSCQVSIDIARKPKLLELMARSGCFTALIGFESLDKRNLHQMNKDWNNPETNYDPFIYEFKKRGIMIYATFVFGYDYDTVDSFERVLNFALRHKFLLANFNPLTPMPGTALYERLQKEDRLLYDKWWLDPTYSYGHAVFRPRGMTPGQLTNGCFKVRCLFNRYRSIASRALDFKTNCRSPVRLGLYLLSNIISRREIFRKQGQSLGTNTQRIKEQGLIR